MGYDKHDEEGRVICQECGNAFNLLAHAHMKKHDMTLSDYKEKYPDFPVSSDKFKTSQRFRTADVFKKEEQPKPISKEELALLDKEDLDKITQSDLEDGILEEDIPVYVKPEDDELLTTKEQVADYLKSIYPNLIVNFAIKKFTFHGHLEYMFSTDMTDVLTRTIFDFPNSPWHTGEYRPTTNKHTILSKDGWKIVSISISSPSINDIKNILDIIDE